jgi:3-deoxy-manno-octulosonate cytidylyltransferase (CMP-KDO synthetase)
MTTLACPLTDAGRWADPDIVKVVRGLDGYALYFSRSPIPFGAADDGSPIKPLHHIGLYAFMRDALLRFHHLSPTALEQQERLEQLRALEHGIRIKVCETERPVFEVNTPDDLERARQLVQQGLVPR